MVPLILAILPCAQVRAEPGPSAAQTLGSAAAGDARIEWVPVQGGGFQMGSDAVPGEKPAHRVSVKSFEAAKAPVTFGQYRACVKAGACAPAHDADGTCWVWTGERWGQGKLPDAFKTDRHPVVCVDWEQAASFAAWAGGRLPSEAEWEYAACNGKENWEYPWGKEKASCERAVMDDGGKGCGRGGSWPVCSKPKGHSAQGLCDMAGNVWEWMRDWYHPGYAGAPADGSPWLAPATKWRAIRGGDWNGNAENLAADDRANQLPTVRSSRIGVRPFRDAGAHP